MKPTLEELKGPNRFIVRALELIDSFRPFYRLPAEPEKLCSALGYRLVKYSDVPEGSLYRTVIDNNAVSDDGFSTGNGVIYYNASKPSNRVRFTLCEEIMHLWIGHTDRPELTTLSREFDPAAYEQAEAEAKGGACLLLCPPAYFLKKNPGIGDIMRDCRVSEACACRITELYAARGEDIKELLKRTKHKDTCYMCSRVKYVPPLEGELL